MIKKIIIISILIFNFCNNLLSSPYTIYTSADTVCLGSSITFTVTGTTGLCQNWYFSDGSSFDDDSVISHTFSYPGQFYVTMTDYNDASCSSYLYDVSIYNIIVVDTSAASISSSLPASICPNTTLNFGTNNYVGKYKWEFGDGATSAQQYPDHKYTTLGIKNIKLILFRPCGNDTAYASIDVVDTIKPDIFWSPTVDYNDTIACPGAGIKFQFTPDPDHTARWYFGNGDSSTVASPTYAYPLQGNYLPFVTVTNGCLKKDSAYAGTIHISTSDTALLEPWHLYLYPSTLCPNTTLKCSLQTALPIDYTYKWYFDDGATSTLAQPTHKYLNYNTYNVRLTVTNACGDTASQTSTVYVTPGQTPSVYSWNWGVESGATTYLKTCQNTPVHFIFDSVFYPDYTFKWYFGDGDSSSLANPVHSFAPGYYTGYLKITNGCNQSIFNYVYIDIPGTDTSVAYIQAPDSVCRFDSVYFESGVYLGPPAISYQWNFGDGGTSSLQNPVYLFTTNGTYNVRLVITNGCGDTDTTYKQITITAFKPPHFEISLSPTNNRRCVYEPFQFNSTLQNPSYTYFWDFGDGVTSTQPSPIHSFSVAGSIGNDLTGVKLVITNGCGIKDSFQLNSDYYINIIPLSVADAGPSRNILLGQSTIIGATPDAAMPVTRKFQWTPATGLDHDNIPFPIATPSITTTYYLSVIDSSYSIDRDCPGMDSVTITVQNILSGRIFRSNYTDTVKAGNVYLIKYDPTNNVQMPTIDTAIINNDGTYSFGYVNQGKYYLLADASTGLYPDAVRTYYGDTAFWTGAQLYNHVSNSNAVDISVKEYGSTVGIGRIAGIVVEGQNYGKMMGPGDPVKGIDVGLVKKPSPGLVQMTTSDTSNTSNAGKFSFNNLPPGNYELIVNITGVPLDISFPNTTFAITATDTSFINVGIYLDSNLAYLSANISGISSPDKNDAGISISRIYPNPATDHVTIEIENYLPNTLKSDQVRFLFYDMRGKEIETTQAINLYKGYSAIRISSVNLKSGIYMMGMQNINEEENNTVKIFSKIVIVR